MARQQPPATRGRVHRLKDGRIGRFGWKAQVASLEDFVLTACANELGLEVPGHHQAASPLAPDAQARGLDLTAGGVRRPGRLRPELASPGLARPVRRTGVGRHRGRPQAVPLRRVRELPHPGPRPVRGIYSDLLLHDMGEKLSDPGDYDTEDSDSPGDRRNAANGGRRRCGGSATRPRTCTTGGRRTWREAVALHGGQGAASADQFRSLRPAQQALIQAFLNSLAAPASAGTARGAPRGRGRPRINRDPGRVTIPAPRPPPAPRRRSP